MLYSLIYAFNLLPSPYMFRRYYLAIFRELTPTSLLKHTAIKVVRINIRMLWYQYCRIFLVFVCKYI